MEKEKPIRKDHGKILEKDESTFMNGAGGAICGGVVSESLMMSDVWAYMMAWYLPDEQFEKYKAAKESGDEKKATKIFDKHAHSMI